MNLQAITDCGFRIYTDSFGDTRLTTSWIHRIIRWLIPAKARQCDRKICAILQEILSNSPLSYGERRQVNQISSQLLSKRYVQITPDLRATLQSTVKHSELQLLAHRLNRGLSEERQFSVETLQAYPKFTRFISANYLDKKALAFGGQATGVEASIKRDMGQTSPHHIEVRHGVPHLLVEGRMICWDQFSQNYLVESGHTALPWQILLKPDGQMDNAYYTYRGIEIPPDLHAIDVDTASLEELMGTSVVFDRQDPAKWNSQWAFSVKTEGIYQQGRFKGDHTWLQLKSPDGRVFSFGLVREGQFSYRTITGKMERLDPNNFFVYRDGRWEETDFAIGKEQWTQILRDLLRKAQEGPVNYHFMQGNCVTLASSITESLAGLQFNARLPIRRAVMAPGAYDWYPKWLTNLIIWTRGGGKVCPEHMAARQAAHLSPATGHFERFRDIFKKRKNLLDSPHALFRIQEQIRKYRYDLRQKILRTVDQSRPEFLELIQMTKFAVPDRFLTQDARQLRQVRRETIRTGEHPSEEDRTIAQLQAEMAGYLPDNDPV